VARISIRNEPLYLFVSRIPHPDGHRDEDEWSNKQINFLDLAFIRKVIN